MHFGAGLNSYFKRIHNVCFCGIISQGTLLGILRPFGPSFYAAFSGNTTVKVLMTGLIFIWNLIRGDLYTALKQTAVIFLRMDQENFIRNEDRVSYLKIHY